MTQAIREVSGITRDAIPDDILTSEEPLVLRGLVADWPLVAEGQASPEAAVRYLKKFYQGAMVALAVGAPEAKGRVFYRDDLSGPNFEHQQAPLDVALDRMLDHARDTDPPLIYVGSTTVETCLPGLNVANTVPLPGRNALESIWIGGKSRIAAHYDLPDNIACVAVGRRRFTLFPPEQLANLYVGPLDMTPAGQAVSVVDLHEPDFERFPKFRVALSHAQQAELEPGDALFIPSMWWHHVEGLAGFNVLINYWWRQSPAHMGPPINALFHALLAVRDLPPTQKAVWKGLFEHYVFNNDPADIEHIPEASRGILGPMDDMSARKLRAFLLNRLNR
ncbi:MAG: cupin-like domain-containing protein [Alphaproteobacteria bacterium]|nr:MAG: cupin-like domain-containing protein [Alphaproteobacteria bacterium]